MNFDKSAEERRTVGLVHDRWRSCAAADPSARQLKTLLFLLHSLVASQMHRFLLTG